jgi:hypothetical protein
MQTADPLHTGATKGGLPRGKALVKSGSRHLGARDAVIGTQKLGTLPITPEIALARPINVQADVSFVRVAEC